MKTDAAWVSRHHICNPKNDRRPLWKEFLLYHIVLNDKDVRAIKRAFIVTLDKVVVEVYKVC